MHTTTRISSGLGRLGGALLGLTLATALASVPAHAVVFGSPTNFAAGDGPRSVVLGDFNGDSRPDLAVANENSDNVSILLGTAGGGLAGPTNFAVGDAPVSVAIGHFNGDSHPDLAVANSLSNNVSILLADGTGGFSSATNFAVDVYPLSVVAADFNGDSNLDLATANAGYANVSILLGNGSGGFSGATNFAVGGYPFSVTTGSFNSTIDSHMDLAVANPGSNTVSILLGNGSGGFGSAANFAVGTYPYSVAVADFNGDSRADLTTANAYGNNVSILLGDGSGVFGAGNNFAVGNGPLSVAAADFDGDPRPDLAVANAASNSVSILLGDGSGAVSAPASFAVSTYPYDIAVGDFNGDLRSDLATANYNSDNISILLDTTGYVRPKGAGPVRASLVPAYNQCAAPNRQHGPALAFPSCNPPAQTSGNLTIGNPNANFTGAVILSAIVGAPGGTDDSDVWINVKMTDVRCQSGVSTCGPANASGGADYTGEVRARIDLRTTDRNNGIAAGGGTDQATGDMTLEATVPCGSSPTPNTIGSTCELTTTADAVYGDPSAAKEGTRAIWELGQVEIYDGGADGDVDTAAGNTLFAVQGLFVP